MLTNDHDKQIFEYYSDLSKKQIQDKEDREQIHHDKLKGYLQGYYYALRKTWEENRSMKERKCYSEGIEKMNNLTAEGKYVIFSI